MTSPCGPLPGLIVTHGGLGVELLRTAELILGPQANVIVHTNTGQSHASLCADLAQAVGAACAGGRLVVLFADLLAGGCGRACSTLAANHRGILLASGVNLPMLLEFLHHREHVGPLELKQRLLDKGRSGVICSGWDDLAEGA